MTSQNSTLKRLPLAADSSGISSFLPPNKLPLASKRQPLAALRVTNGFEHGQRDLRMLTNDEIEFGRFSDLEERFGIRRSTAYALLEDGEIGSRYVRPRGSKTCVRLIDFNSVREFLAKAPKKPKASIQRQAFNKSLLSVARREELAAQNGVAE